jgi:hypothetical protein
MKTENKNTSINILRKLAVSLMLLGGLAAAVPHSASAGSMPVTTTVVAVDGEIGDGPVMASVGWGGCGGCSR